MKKSFLPGTKSPSSQPPIWGLISTASWQWKSKQQWLDHLWATADKTQVCRLHIPSLSITGSKGLQGGVTRRKEPGSQSHSVVGGMLNTCVKFVE